MLPSRMINIGGIYFGQSEEVVPARSSQQALEPYQAFSLGEGNEILKLPFPPSHKLSNSFIIFFSSKTADHIIALPHISLSESGTTPAFSLAAKIHALFSLLSKLTPWTDCYIYNLFFLF